MKTTTDLEKRIRAAYDDNQTVCAIAQSGVCYTGKIVSIEICDNSNNDHFVIEDDGQTWTVISRTVCYNHISSICEVGDVLELVLNVQ